MGRGIPVSHLGNPPISNREERFHLNTMISIPFAKTGSLEKKMRQQSPEMDDAERELPDEVVEMIITKLPFPFLFKARVLSKRWYLKFPTKTPSPFHLMTREASAFQREVSVNSSASWGSYAPVFINWTNMSLLAFDRSKSPWVRSLPRNIWQHWRSRPPVWIAGSLVLLAVQNTLMPTTLPTALPRTLSVASVVTGSCRHLRLPLPPDSRGRTYVAYPGPKILIAEGCHSYKVLSVYHVNHYMETLETDIGAMCVHVYDSNSQLWTSTLNHFKDTQALNGFCSFFEDYGAYMDGKIYILALYEGQLLESVKLLSYDLENTAWTVVAEGIADEKLPLHECSGVFRCLDRVIVVIMSKHAMMTRKRESWEVWDTIAHREEHMEAVEDYYRTGTIWEKSIQVFQLDTQSLKLVSLSDGPPGIRLPLEVSKCDIYLTPPRISADASFLYFGWDCCPNSGVKFDLNNQEWSSIPLVNSTLGLNWERHHAHWIHGSFEPGLNPFVSA